MDAHRQDHRRRLWETVDEFIAYTDLHTSGSFHQLPSIKMREVPSGPGPAIGLGDRHTTTRRRLNRVVAGRTFSKRGDNSSRFLRGPTVGDHPGADYRTACG